MRIISRIRIFFTRGACAARVEEMSRAFDLVSETMRPFLDETDGDRLQEARQALAPLREMVDNLNEYQRSGQWLKDFEADEAGLLPAGISRSVLSEDGLYNLLEDFSKFVKINTERND